MRLLRPEDITQCGEVGGKARGLLHLAKAGARVPPWVVIPAEDVAAATWDQATLEALFHELAQPPFSGVAVRSSAAAEDGGQASLAGVYETRFAHTPEELLPAIRTVAGAAHAMRVRVHTGTEDAQLAIVLQAGVKAAWAGVLFSADPAAARLDEAYVEIVVGAGEGLVSGACQPSRAWLSFSGQGVARFLPGKDGPVRLDGEMARTLAENLARVETVMRRAVDIEFACDGDGDVWFVQARPLTALSVAAALLPGRCATSWFFDQRFSRPISPLTRTSLLPLIVEEGPGSALRMRGRELPPGSLHFHGGQAYLDHGVYRAMFSGAPRWLLTTDLQQIFPGSCYCGEVMPHDMGHYIRSAFAALYRHAGEALLNLPRWAHFRDGLAEALDEAVAPWQAQPGDTTAWLAAWRQLDGLTRRFLALHRWSLLWADYGYRIYRGLLACMPQAARAGVEHKLRAELRIVTRDANAAAAACLRGELGVEDFRAHYGHRSASLDYAEPTWSELLDEGRLAGVAPNAEDAPEKRAPRGLLSCLMAPLRRALEMREEQRFHWERILARQRALLVEAGRKLVDEGKLTSVDALWLLEWEELSAALRAEAVPGAAAIAQRRHALLVEACIAKPAFIGPRARAPVAPANKAMRGVGVSAGRVTGTAVIMAEGPVLDGLPEDAIAVLPSLDPAGSVLLPRVRGVVLARGGLLAHAAILAREYGVPMVTGIDDAPARIRHGAAITVDGDTGVVTVETPPREPLG
jgi:pyruvate,water dikinase